MAKKASNRGQDKRLSSFVVAGASFRFIKKQLRPAFPKKKDRDIAMVSVSADERSVKIALTGATVVVPAMSSDCFRCLIPWTKFQVLIEEKYEDIELVTVSCGKATVRYQGISIHSTAIDFELIKKGEPKNKKLVQAYTEDRAPAKDPFGSGDSQSDYQAEIQHPIDFVNDAPLGLPLLGAYAYIKKYGHKPNVANQTFAQHQERVERLLADLQRRCEPLGIGRADIEKLIDSKIGIRNSASPTQGEEH